MVALQTDSVPYTIFISPNMPFTFLSVYHDILHFFRMSSTSTPVWCEIPIDPAFIQMYCDRLKTQYILEGGARMNALFVEEVSLYKTARASRHEYLAAKVRAPDDVAFYLAFERGRGEKVTDGEGDTSCQPPSPSASAPRLLSIASLDSISNIRKALDTVTLLTGMSGKHNHNDKLMCRMFFPSPPHEPSSSLPASPPISVPTSSSPPPICLPLYELAVLANTIHDMRENYLLFSDNCFWYAGTIIRVLQAFYHPVLPPAKTPQPDRKVIVLPNLRMKGREIEADGRKAGLWNGIELYAGEKIDLNPLIEEFNKALKIFREPVVEHEAEEIAKGLQLKVAEARSKVAEAELKRAEAEIDRLRLMYGLQVQQ